MSKRFYGGIFYEPKLMIELGVEHPISLLYYLTYENARLWNRNCKNTI